MTLLRIALHAACYVLASALIALHLAHGLASAWISLGWMSRDREHVIRRTMRGWAATLTLGFAATALAPWLGQS